VCRICRVRTNDGIIQLWSRPDRPPRWLSVSGDRTKAQVAGFRFRPSGCRKPRDLVPRKFESVYDHPESPWVTCPSERCEQSSSRPVSTRMLFSKREVHRFGNILRYRRLPSGTGRTVFPKCAPCANIAVVRANRGPVFVVLVVGAAAALAAADADNGWRNLKNVTHHRSIRSFSATCDVSRDRSCQRETMLSRSRSIRPVKQSLSVCRY
jgi:hypothetical protein